MNAEMRDYVAAAPLVEGTAWRSRRTASVLPAPVIDGCRRALQQIGFPDISLLGVTSSVRGEGRTTVALGCGLALAEYGIPTCVVELDLESPSLASLLGLGSNRGLANHLEGTMSLEELARPVVDNLVLVPAGKVGGSAPRALAEISGRKLLRELQGQGYTIIADLPPLVESNLGLQAASLLPDLLLVVRAGKVPAAAVKEAVSSLETPPPVLVNGVASRIPSWARQLAGL